MLDKQQRRLRLRTSYKELGFNKHEVYTYVNDIEVVIGTVEKIAFTKDTWKATPSFFPQCLDHYTFKNNKYDSFMDAGRALAKAYLDDLNYTEMMEERQSEEDRYYEYWDSLDLDASD